MFFQTCEHYSLDNDSLDEQSEIHECFICLENDVNQTLSITRLQNLGILEYYKICKCDGWVHSSCLTKWYCLQKRCPICREKIYSNNNIFVNSLQFRYFCVIILDKCILLFKMIFFVYSMLYVSFILYYLCFITIL
jgi:hypothetical protein